MRGKKFIRANTQICNGTKKTHIWKDLVPTISKSNLVIPENFDEERIKGKIREMLEDDLAFVPNLVEQLKIQVKFENDILGAAVECPVCDLVIKLYYIKVKSCWNVGNVRRHMVIHTDPTKVSTDPFIEEENDQGPSAKKKRRTTRHSNK